MYLCVCIYIYIYIERERDIHERRVDAEVEQLGRILGRLDIITNHSKIDTPSPPTKSFPIKSS